MEFNNIPPEAWIQPQRTVFNENRLREKRFIRFTARSPGPKNTKAKTTKQILSIVFSEECLNQMGIRPDDVDSRIRVAISKDGVIACQVTQSHWEGFKPAKYKAKGNDKFIKVSLHTSLFIPGEYRNLGEKEVAVDTSGCMFSMGELLLK